MNQKKAKVLIKDYLRETGRKGVTSLMRDLAKFEGSSIFSKRTLELWLQEQDRQLDDRNWDVVSRFIESDKFKSVVPYMNEGSANERLKQVAEGFIALYGKIEHPDGMYILPSRIQEQGMIAVRELDGNWENIPNQADRDVPRTICKMEPIPGTRYAKFAYLALFRSRQISATGLVIYLNSDELKEYDYCHMFVLQLWRRRDPQTGSNMPGELTFLIDGKDQPEFSISSVLNQYFYKSDDPIVTRGGVKYEATTNPETDEMELRGKLSAKQTFKFGFNEAAGSTVLLKKNKSPFPEEEKIIDQLLEDVLPHGYA
ncbi:hypothetical protein [Halioxenophilus sp. WMMB6]|uniref:hypothetical protein n=1 Tax=Halioxenophilus sp. WMMB6 TaxID=3073815 RepID=UPI00295E71A8|nr:hypothetical protein [Halioxenophilus sp. WMMB6]